MVVFSVKSVFMFLSLQVVKVQLLNILAVFPYEGRSHFLVFESLLKELAGKGHNLTVISYFPQENAIPNYRDIALEGNIEENKKWVKFTEPSYYKIIVVTIFLLVTGTNNCKVLLSDENVQNLWKNETKFDVILVEQFNSDCALGLAHKLKAPLLNGGTKPNIIQRIERTVFMIYFQYVVRVMIQTINQYTLSQYFHDLPSLEDLGRNIKLMLLNEHFTFLAPSILPSNVKEVGGLHVAENKPLPMDLEKFINDSEHGVIYISFGTMVGSSSIPPEKLQAILRTIAKLQQRVIWKWDADTLPDKQNNIYMAKWLPQNDILAHPKVVAMFYHCGLLGLMEAMFYGVPVVGMPIFGDQPRNAAALEESGLGVQIQVNKLSEDTLIKKFKIILDIKFREKVKMLSKRWRDRPIAPKEEAIYWIEYVARYPNATLNTAAADLSLYQYLCLDVMLIFGILFASSFFLFKCVLNIYRNKHSKAKKFGSFKSKQQ
ncbi:UDP-glucosyltransferase 2-like isoform X2 [Nymphalis io]|uniref:UDP-glucosyltransferase 2-like isoform X2 n=1 Tax=Inachis io TaxID=171585 RepID=UPI0021683E7C|nr:UDP-glucosyltransferase 2-like isoform X2 [Nymphalis io]